MEAFLIWVFYYLGILAENAEACYTIPTEAQVKVCVSGGNRVPKHLGEEPIPVKGADAAIQLRKEF